MRALAAGHLTVLSFVVVVAVYVESECGGGLAAEALRRTIGFEQYRILLLALLLPSAALRWVAWAARHESGVDWRSRAGAVLGAWALTLLVAVAIWAAIPRLAVPRYWSRADLSRELLGVETVALLIGGLALATAPAGLVRALLARPAEAMLATSMWSLAGPGAAGWSLSHSCHAALGWGRLLLLGAATGVGFVAGGRLASRRASETRAAPAPSWCPTAPILALVASLGWPGPPLWVLLLRKSPIGLARGEAAERLIDLCERSLNLPAVGLLQVLLACHLVRAWRRRRSLLHEGVVCAGFALHLLLLPLAWVPEQVDLRALDQPLLLVPPWVAVAGSAWMVIALGLFWARSRS